MKQHITAKQLNELSEKGKERLFQWWKPIFDIPKGFEYRLSIGQMIKFLHNEWPKEDKVFYEIVYRNAGWAVMVYDSNSYKSKSGYNEVLKMKVDDVNWKEGLSPTPYKKELCDALWQAVKEVLEK